MYKTKNMAQLVARLKIKFLQNLKEIYLGRKEKSMFLLNTIKAKSQIADSMLVSFSMGKDRGG